MAKRDIEPNWHGFKARGADGDFLYWSQEQRRAYRRKQMAQRLDACRREQPMGDRIVFRCDHRKYGCSCGGRFVFWHVDQEGNVTLRDAEGDHRRFSERNIAKRQKSGLWQRHTQSELRDIRAAIIRDIAAADAALDRDPFAEVEVRCGRGRRADILRLIQKHSGRGFERARQMLRELVEGGYLSGKDYAVLKMPPGKRGISKVSLHYGREARAKELAARSGMCNPRSSAKESSSPREHEQKRRERVRETNEFRVLSHSSAKECSVGRLAELYFSSTRAGDELHFQAAT